METWTGAGQITALLECIAGGNDSGTLLITKNNKVVLAIDCTKGVALSLSEAINDGDVIMAKAFRLSTFCSIIFEIDVDNIGPSIVLS